MGPTCQRGGTDMVRVRVNPKLGLTDYSNSVGPIWEISDTEIWPSKLGEPIAYLGGTENIAIGNREFATPSRWDRDPYR